MCLIAFSQQSSFSPKEPGKCPAKIFWKYMNNISLQKANGMMQCYHLLSPSPSFLPKGHYSQMLSVSMGWDNAFSRNLALRHHSGGKYPCEINRISSDHCLHRRRNSGKVCYSASLLFQCGFCCYRNTNKITSCDYIISFFTNQTKVHLVLNLGFLSRSSVQTHLRMGFSFPWSISNILSQDAALLWIQIKPEYEEKGKLMTLQKQFALKANNKNKKMCKLYSSKLKHSKWQPAEQEGVKWPWCREICLKGC